METIELGNDTTRPPSLKLRNLGDHVVVAIIDQAEIPWTEYQTNAPKLGKDGKPRTQEVYTALVVSAQGGVTTIDDTDTPVGPGDLVSIYLAGHKRWNRVEAYKKLGRKVRVGDVWRWGYSHDEPSEGGQSPKKVHTLEARDARPDEDGQTERCIALYRDRQQAPAMTAPDAGGFSYGAEEPF